MAQDLGLHRNCDHWNIPLEECETPVCLVSHEPADEAAAEEVTEGAAFER